MAFEIPKVTTWKDMGLEASGLLTFTGDQHSHYRRQVLQGQVEALNDKIIEKKHPIQAQRCLCKKLTHIKS